MQQISLTPFGRRPVDSGLLAARARAAEPCGKAEVDKWALLSDLRIARKQFGISDRDLAVLYALLTFLPSKTLTSDAALVVFPSNASLSDRAHGMAESTLRRHLAALVNAGLIWRQDSPNGKRYARRGVSGGLTIAYGFDLRPLLHLAAEISLLARDTLLAREALHSARQCVVLQLRDAAKLLAYGRESALPGDWDQIESRLPALRAAMRRKMDGETLAELMAEGAEILHSLTTLLSLEPEKMIATAAHYERHHTESNKDAYESEIVLTPAPDPQTPLQQEALDCHEAEKTTLPLTLVLKACPDLKIYSRNNLTSWHDLFATVSDMRSMMGITSAPWEEATRVMGRETAAITVAAILQRITHIANPGGYLRSLTAKAANAGFSPTRMIMALLKSPNRVTV